MTPVDASNAPHMERLRYAAQMLGLVLTDAQLTQLLDYMRWIQKWNRVYNLTSLREPAEILTHHLIDSLSAVPPLMRHLAGLPGTNAGEGVGVGARLLDVGSGGGLPGVVLAICLPQLSVTCVDTVAKKAAFIQQVAAALRLPNLKGLHARVEAVQGGYDVVSSRAFASLVDFTNWSVNALKPGAVWMAMKGKHPEQELTALGANVVVFHVEQLKVPGLDAERCLLWMRVAAG